MTYILIGMPGSGKSTIGRNLSLLLNQSFIDTDDIIIFQNKKSLKELINNNFEILEYNAVKSIPSTFNGIISTGGSVIYSNNTMNYLKSLGTIIYLKVSCDEILNRIGDYKNRGIIIKSNMTFNDLYNERIILYEKWSDIIINNYDLKKTISQLLYIIK